MNSQKVQRRNDTPVLESILNEGFVRVRNISGRKVCYCGYHVYKKGNSRLLYDPINDSRFVQFHIKEGDKYPFNL